VTKILYQKESDLALNLISRTLFRVRSFQCFAMQPCRLALVSQSISAFFCKKKITRWIAVDVKINLYFMEI